MPPRSSPRPSPWPSASSLEPGFLAELSTRWLRHGGPFLGLGFDQRTAVVLEELSFDNPDRVLYEAAAAVPFTAFCAAAVHEVGTRKNASGCRVMGYPGARPQGYRNTGARQLAARGEELGLPAAPAGFRHRRPGRFPGERYVPRRRGGLKVVGR